MRRRIARLWPVLLLAPSASRRLGRRPTSRDPSEARLRAHVVTLASPEYLGRRGAGGERRPTTSSRNSAASGSNPSSTAPIEQTIPGKNGEPPMGRNVGAVLRGSDPKLRDEWVIVSAHYDHLGRPQRRRSTPAPTTTPRASP